VFTIIVSFSRIVVVVCNILIVTYNISISNMIKIFSIDSNKAL